MNENQYTTLLGMIGALTTTVANMGRDLRKEMRGEIRSEMRGLATKAELSGLRDDMRTELRNLATKGELAELRQEMHDGLADVHKSHQQILTAIGAQVETLHLTSKDHEHRIIRLEQHRT